ncbi:hypothetical protein L5F43_09905 [Aliarcobacter butzleri]|uniref:Uncharacterized protein n=2 Tax=Aliarcobacter butzleri TaxID=28197 RepID=A0AAW7Q0Y4_9BACT|nr:hypothetical protein [Aliarcobacter butzleri]KLD99300.1 hypothetical protein AA20_07225 [Aliarcobacter butzleri L348]MCG3655444.1 hypothetical protein [Aliarcobacter butzleri]MCG3684339.1 hypothetical protein [Aliarcobacter butzleri]MCG3688471.1 hypothetical protein [Aliarcobacter butzleri]MCG3706791.1 hypothetical protein [Aliarcobacter butzleri]
MNISLFEDLIKELSLKYEMQDIDILTIFVESAEEIFNTNIQIIKKNDVVHLSKIENNKKINLNKNTLKKISTIFEDKLINSNKKIQIENAKKMLKNKAIIFFEILKKEENFFICSFNNLIAFLPFGNIPIVDFDNFSIGSKHYGIVHSYSFNKNEIVLNCKHNLVEIKKVKSVILNINVTKVNRFYGQRIKIYTDTIPNKTLINNLKMLYAKEKVIFVKVKNV